MKHKGRRMTTCKCFTCTHKDPRLKKAYCIGYMEACEWFLNWAKEQGIKMGSISDNDIGGIYAQINCNYQETACYASDLPDIDEVNELKSGSENVVLNWIKGAKNE